MIDQRVMSSSGIFPANFPATLINAYKCHIPFTSDKKDVASSLAERIASLYADFLTVSYHVNRSPKLNFNSFPNLFPNRDEVVQFHRDLKDTLIQTLTADKTPHKIELRTGRCPLDSLADILEKNGITSAKYPCYALFPEMTYLKLEENEHGFGLQMTAIQRPSAIEPLISFPTQLIPNFLMSFYYRTNDQAAEIAEAISGRIVSIYTQFLKIEWHRVRGNMLAFFDFPSRFPYPQQVDVFKTHLDKLILHTLFENQEGNGKICLSVKGAPVGALLRICEACGIDALKTDLHMLFPLNTETQIVNNRFEKKIEICMHADKPYKKKV